MKKLKTLGAWAMRTLPGRVVAKFVGDGGTNQATIIGWNVLLAMFPIVLAAVTVLGLVMHLAGMSPDRAYNDLLSFLPADARPRPQDLQSLQKQAGLLSVVSFLGLVWSGAALFGTMEQSFALVYHTKPRPFVRQKVMGVLMILLFTALGGLAVFTSTLLPLIQNVLFFPDALRRGAFVLQVVIGVVSGFCLFLAIFYVVPNRRQRWGQVWPGALLSGVLFEAITLGFPVYINLQHGFNRYGSAFALLFLLMSYVYFIGIITMLGVELNSVLYPVPVEQPRAAEIAPAGAGSRSGLRRASGRATTGP